MKFESKNLKSFTFLLLGDGVCYMFALHLQHHLQKNIKQDCDNEKNKKRVEIDGRDRSSHFHFDEYKQRQSSNEDPLQNQQLCISEKKKKTHIAILIKKMKHAI